MKKKQDIDPSDSKRRHHGYQEWYLNYDNDKLSYRGVYKHGKAIGYREHHQMKKTVFCLK